MPFAAAMPICKASSGLFSGIAFDDIRYSASCCASVEISRLDIVVTASSRRCAANESPQEFPMSPAAAGRLRL